MDKQNNRNLLKQAILDGISQRYEEELSATQEFLLYSKRSERKRRRMKRILLGIIVAALASAVLAVSFAYFAGSVRGTVAQVTEDGRAELDIMPQKVLEELSVGDTALVKIGSFRAEMPLVEELIPEEGKLQLLLDRENGSVLICSYREDVCERYGICVGDRVTVRKSKN
ncbi:MAG: hypothetical protein IJD59_02990 [Clostridia bacterium]|nr:hypothetical protein [Clostridia bacterium]